MTIPRRRSLHFYALATVVLVCFSYLFTLALAVVCIYVPWLIVTNATNFSTAVLFVAGVLAAGVMLWSLVPRGDGFKPIGLRLDQAEHPALFAELQTIAGALGEPLPSEVYLVGDPNAWVGDRGGRLGFGTRRIMGIGLPLLGALSVSEFRAVLAHEFGHYYGGDTKLGPWLRRTQMAMMRTLQGMESIGKLRLHAFMTALFVAVGGILQSYWRAFLRAITFMSRKQEYRADELACLIAGPASLVGGLRQVQAAAAAWPAFWSSEAAPMLGWGCLPPLARNFSQFLVNPSVVRQVETGIENLLRDAQPQPYDSHPPLRDRIAAAQKITVSAASEDARPAWILLNNVDQAECDLLAAMNPGLPSKALKRLSSWEEALHTVVVPAWTRAISAHVDLLRGITAGNLAESFTKIQDIAARLPSPAGMLLARGERVPQALHLLAGAFTIALLNDGWTIHTSAGTVCLKKDDERLQPFQLVFQLFDGTLARDEWARICERHGIAQLEFAPLPV